MDETNKDNIVTYTSSDKDKRTAYKFLAIEIAVIIIFVLGIILVLNYFAIFPLSKINPTLFGFLPTQQKAEKYEIVVISEIPGYEVNLKDRSGLISLLESWGFFIKNYSVDYGVQGSTNGVPVSRLVIRLVSTEQPTNRYAEGNTIYLSSLARVSEGQMEVKIHLGENLLKDENKNSKDLGNYIKTGLLTTVYKATHSVKTKAEGLSRQEDLNKLLNQEEITSKIFFDVIRKKD